MIEIWKLPKEQRKLVEIELKSIQREIATFENDISTHYGCIERLIRRREEFRQKLTGVYSKYNLITNPGKIEKRVELERNLDIEL